MGALRSHTRQGFLDVEHIFWESDDEKRALSDLSGPHKSLEWRTWTMAFDKVHTQFLLTWSHHMFARLCRRRLRLDPTNPVEWLYPVFDLRARLEEFRLCARTLKLSSDVREELDAGYETMASIDAVHMPLVGESKHYVDFFVRACLEGEGQPDLWARRKVLTTLLKLVTTGEYDAEERMRQYFQLRGLASQ